MDTISRVRWTLRELTLTLRKRQMNKFDCNIAVSGRRGLGKSTLLFKVFNAFKDDGFNPRFHQVYEREDVMKLLSEQKRGFCWDDEAINSGYKRDFQNKGQQTLIKLVTNYRDNFNIYASAIPSFYSLDKDLRELIFLHIHIIKRGHAVIFMPLKSSLHTTDPWDTKNNIKIEERENKRLEKNPEAHFRYHKFTTFVGYLEFGDMTDKQRKLYEAIKVQKRAKKFEEDINGEAKAPQFLDRIYERLMSGKLTKEGLLQICLIEGKKYSSISSSLNIKLRDAGVGDTLTNLLLDKPKQIFDSKISSKKKKIMDAT